MQTIRFYNTLTRQLDVFDPLKGGKVTLYTCGPTVYSYPQIGNWVAYIRWDTLVRMLIESGFEVTRVMNITDVGHLVSDADEGEDKMEKGARREGKTTWEVAQFYTEDFLEGMHKFNLLEPQYVTKATDYIAQQIELVRRLESKGLTYIIDDGVYFDTSKFPAYADFARLDLEALKAGARVAFSQGKRNVSDFALWKFSQPDQRRDMEWESPWGKGFPGWHLECSAMAIDMLGESIDIHTGGIDHIPVHHTNEIAQSEAATGKRFANYWLHNNFLLVDGAKAAKSLGNAYTLQDIEARGYDALDFRMFVMQSHYRTESNFSWDNLESARIRLRRWRQIADLRWQPLRSNKSADPEPTAVYIDTVRDVLTALQQDMDTPKALAIIEDAFDRAQHGIDEQSTAAFSAFIEAVDRLLGLDLQRPDIADNDKQLLQQREKSRLEKDWKNSDAIRDELAGRNIIVQDTSEGQLWHHA